MDITKWEYNSEPFEEWENNSLTEGYIPAWFGPAGFTTLKSRDKSNDGVFLFLKMTREEQTDASIPSLESRLKKYLSEPVHQQVRFLWIDNPLEELSQWRNNSISVEGNFGNRRVSCLAHLDLHNYSFSIAKGTTLELKKNGTDKKNRVARQFVFSKIKNNQRGFELSAGNGLHRFSDISDTMILPMYDESLGCLQFELELKKEINTEEETPSFGYPSLNQLDIGLRIFFRDPEFPEPGDSFYLASHRYPIFDETHLQLDGNDNPHKAFKYYPSTIPFKVQLDLLYPLVAERTHFIFKEIPGVGKSTGLPSSYRTNLGYRVHLIPFLEKSRLQFAFRPSLLSNEKSHSTPLYLVPAGQFKIQVPNYHDDTRIDLKAESNVDCGISGVEYIKIKSKPAAIFTFVPGQAAYALAHVSVTALLRDFPIIYEAETGDTLTEDTTDQDAAIIDKRTDLQIIDNDSGVDYLEIIKNDYFPTNFSFSFSQSAEYNKLERVEELVTWLQDTLISSGIGNGDLNDQATTSWVYISQGAGAVYYAQPEQAILYKAEESSIDFLDYLEIPSVGLPPELSINGEARAFPMLPYGDVDPYALADLKLLEVSLINHFRRKRIQEISAEIDHVTPLVLESEEAEKNPIGTTPQGLIATFSKDYKTISRLELARDTHEPIPMVIPFVDIQHGTPLKAALQSNQLFMVISDPSSISTNFKKELVDALDTLDTTSMEIKKWIFELGTESWNKNNRNTILIFKFHDKPLVELAARPDLWSFPYHFNGDDEVVAVASSTLLTILYDAIEIGGRVDPKESGKYEMLAEAATQANWTGILGFNIHVPPGGLPPELLALAAGIDPELFFAQYIGIELTQVTSDGTNLKPEGSSLFGLIDYSNPEIPVATESGYNFHVASLVVVFENSRIKDFAAEILLVIEKLFDEPSRLLDSPRNIVSLIGVAEEHNGKMTYSFGFKGANRFKLSGNAFEEIEIIKAQFVTDPIPDPIPDPDLIQVVGRFIFWGRIRFAYLEEFDILSFGKSPSILTDDPDYLSFSNMQILMEFNLEKEATTMPVSTFTFVPNQMAFDLEKSGWRSNSLYEKFPLIFKGFLIGKSDGSLQRGFMEVITPLEPIVLGENDQHWYGMSFALNMESSEDIGAKAKIKADILVGWNAGKKGIYVGLRFPGSSGTDRSITIVGILKLVFKSIRFVAYPLTTEWDDNGNKLIGDNVEREVGYLLNLKNIRLEFFVLSFPPTGRTEITLFGDPTRGIEREKRLVGWYAAYVKK
ncbi:MAG: hypothetical protein AB8F94_30385 [Saprospiraceae bacterium]